MSSQGFMVGVVWPWCLEGRDGGAWGSVLVFAFTLRSPFVFEGWGGGVVRVRVGVSMVRAYGYRVYGFYGQGCVGPSYRVSWLGFGVRWSGLMVRVQGW